MKKVWGMLRGNKGFTLVELMVVMAIIAVLAAIVVPTVSGVTGKGSETAKGQDITQVQSQLDQFNSDSDTGEWPTKADIAAIPAWTAGNLPTSGKYAGIEWTTSTNVSGTPKAFYPDYIKKQPRHASEVATDLTTRWRIDSKGIVSMEMDGGRY